MIKCFVLLPECYVELVPLWRGSKFFSAASGVSSSAKVSSSAIKSVNLVVATSPVSSRRTVTISFALSLSSAVIGASTVTKT